MTQAMRQHLKHMVDVRPRGLDRDAAEWALAEIERLGEPQAAAPDLEHVHQQIYKAAYDRMRPFLADEKLANAFWLATEDAAKALASRCAATPQQHTADEREAAFDRWWKLSIHNGTLYNMTLRASTREAYFAAWGGAHTALERQAYTEKQVREMLERQCKDAGSQKAWADLHNISAAYVNDVLSERRDIGRTIAEALGLQRVCVYEPQRMAPREQFRQPDIADNRGGE